MEDHIKEQSIDQNKYKFRPRLCQKCGIQEFYLEKAGKKPQQCAKCRNISYCSVKCQTLDWPQHKAFCKFHAEKKPSATDDPPEVSCVDYPHGFTLEFALAKCLDSIIEEVMLIIKVPYFPLLHAKRRQPLLVHLEFQWFPDVPKADASNFRRQFLLIRAVVTTSNDLFGFPKPDKTTLDWLKVVEKEEKLRREGLSDDEQGQLSAAVNFVVTGVWDSPIGIFSTVNLRSMGFVAASHSSLDPRNLNLPWAAALYKSLSLPPLIDRKDLVDYHPQLIRLMEIYGGDAAWLRRSKEYQLEPFFHDELVRQEMEVAGSKVELESKLRKLAKVRNSFGYVWERPFFSNTYFSNPTW